MFTGIVTHTTDIVSSDETAAGLRLTFKKPLGWSDLVIGESVAVDGVCLTIETITDDSFSCVLIPETLGKTTFGKTLPKKVNLERALQVGDRLSGHVVQGHVDETGKVTNVQASDDYRIAISISPAGRKLVASKGSITIQGVALTIAELHDGELVVALVPYTLQETTLKKLKVGDLVNLEFDILGKYAVNGTE